MKWTTDLNHPEPSLVTTYKATRLRMVWRGSDYIVVDATTGLELVRAPTKGQLYTRLRNHFNLETSK